MHRACHNSVVPSRLSIQAHAERRRARRVGALGFALALGLPVVLFHRVVGAVSLRNPLDPRYLVGWAPWALIAVGLLFFVPVVISAGRDPSWRLYPRARNAYAAWGITLYLLGFALATQVASMVSGPGLR
jgi:hypothetical protein